MPTIFTHGAVALAIAGRPRAFGAPGRVRLLVTAALLSMLPDLDVIGFRFGVQYHSTFGHRGFTHSFFFAALVALLCSWLLLRRARLGALIFTKTFLLLFAATASHGLLDAFTDGGEGVAFLSPFSNHRYFFPWRPILVSPIGVGSFFSSWRGALILLNELSLVVVPAWLALYFPELRARAKARKKTFACLVLLWLALLAFFAGLSPLNGVLSAVHGRSQPVIDLYTKQYGNPGILRQIPLAGIREGKLVTSFQALQELGLFNQRNEARNAPAHWASGFFPQWFGGIAGRWQDPNPLLFLRSLVGFDVIGPREIVDLLKEGDAKGDFLFRLSPTEKYDLALGDYAFNATKSILAGSHNSDKLLPFWFGICNGMAAASKAFEEPFRAVDVVNPNGFRIRFHPNDIKALLGYSLAEISLWTELGTRCWVDGPEARACRINPGLFFLATMNRVGLARDSFIVDGFAARRKQFYLMDAARVEVLRPPTPVAEWKGWAVPTPVK